MKKKEPPQTTEKFCPIWEIPSFLKCPLIGACLTIGEHEKILRKAGYPVKRLSAYKLHQRIIGRMDTENFISLKVDRILKHKYRTDLAESGTLDDDEFRKIWRLRNKTGEIDGIFYVAAVKTDLGAELLSDIFGDVHMAMHLTLKGLRETRRDLGLQIEANQKTSRLYNQGKIRTRKLARENTALKTTLGEMRVSSARQDNNGNRGRSDALEKENRTLRTQYQESENDKLKLNDQIRFLEREKRQLEIDFFASQSTKEQFLCQNKPKSDYYTL